MAMIAVTFTAYALIPADEYELRESEVLDAMESALQGCDATYATPTATRGIPAEVSDTL